MLKVNSKGYKNIWNRVIINWIKGFDKIIKIITNRIIVIIKWSIEKLQTIWSICKNNKIRTRVVSNKIYF